MHPNERSFIKSNPNNLIAFATYFIPIAPANMKNKSSTAALEMGSGQKKEAIFESTLKLIHEHGFHGTPMSQIAIHANVATGTIYHYFTSKDELILELFKYCREKTNEHIFQLDEDLSYQERFAAIWKRLVEYYIENKEIFRFVEQFHSSPYYELMQELKDSSYYGADSMRKFFEEGIQAGIIKNVSFFTLMSIYFGPAISLIKNVTYNKFCKINEQDHKDLIGIIWNGIKSK